MKKNSKKGVLISISVGMAMMCTVSYADWQYTRWGMSPKQVVAASKGKAKPFSSETMPDVRAQGGYQSGTFHFKVNFAFRPNDNQLSEVELVPLDNSTCHSIKLNLEGKYGQAVNIETNEYIEREESRWHDRKQNNLVSFASYPNRCFLKYKQLSTSDGKGL